MSTDNIHARKDEKEQIDIHSSNELIYWANRFGVTQEMLVKAVRTVGDSPKAIENYFKKNPVSIKKNY